VTFAILFKKGKNWTLNIGFFLCAFFCIAVLVLLILGQFEVINFQFSIWASLLTVGPSIMMIDLLTRKSEQ
jgi:hypothetical protein